MLDFIVSPGKARPHRVNAALDRQRERQLPTRLRIVIEANLPRGQDRPPRMEYQRLASWMIDCRSSDVAVNVRHVLRDFLRRLKRTGVVADCPQDAFEGDDFSNKGLVP